MRAPAPAALRLRAAVLAAALAAAAAAPLRAQDSAAAARAPVAFFATEEPLALTLSANLKQLRRDDKDKAPWRPASVEYAEAGGGTRRVPLRVRTRGIWRLKNCEFPPLRLNFSDSAARGTVFEGLDKPKLVNYCRDTDGYEQYVLREAQLYRIFAVLTPASHHTRLVRMAYADAASGKVDATRYAIVLEEPDAVARRLGGAVVEAQGARADDLAPFQAALVGVFQYMIGNSDWSTAYLHNAELVRDSTLEIQLVPYDFDFSGAVNASYATVDPNLPIKRVRERIYRGHCVPAEEYARVFALFNERKDAIYALYHDQIGRLLTARSVRETLAYFDEFYDIINSRSAAQRRIIDACAPAQ